MPKLRLLVLLARHYREVFQTAGTLLGGLIVAVILLFVEFPAWVKVGIVALCIIAAQAIVSYRILEKVEPLYRFAKLKAREAQYHLEYWNGGNLYIDPAIFREAALKHFAKLEESVAAGDFSVAVDILAIKPIMMDHAYHLADEKERDALQYRITVLIQAVSRHLEATGKRIGIEDN